MKRPPRMDCELVEMREPHAAHEVHDGGAVYRCRGVRRRPLLDRLWAAVVGR